MCVYSSSKNRFMFMIEMIYQTEIAWWNIIKSKVKSKKKRIEITTRTKCEIQRKILYGFAFALTLYIALNNSHTKLLFVSI